MPTREPRIIELDAPHRPAFRPQLVVPLALAFTFVLPFLILLAWPLGVAVSSLFSKYPLYSVIATVASLTPVAILATWSLAKAAERRRTQLVDEGRHLPIDDRVRLLVAKLGNNAHHEAAEIAPAIARDNVANVVVLLGKARALHQHPLDVAFEPIPLDESAPQFAVLARERSSSPADQKTAASEGAFDLPATWRRRLRLGAGWLLLIMFAINLPQSAAGAWNAGRPTFEFVFWLALLLLMVFGGLGAWRSTDQWLLVPCGVVRRSARSRSAHWDLHLFTRPGSLLLIAEGRRTTRHVCLADVETHAATEITVAEAELLLRAWLSPFPPPSIEQLSDLT